MPPTPKGRKPSRDERLAAALRENLKRRKQAARAVARPPAEPAAEPPPPRPNAAQKPG
ncbi:MAG: hypothetical protein WDN08_07990 [Rhizomicrobium sp.]